MRISIGLAPMNGEIRYELKLELPSWVYLHLAGSALTCILNGLTLRSLGEFSQGDPFAKERLNGPFVQSRDVSVLLSGRRCAGVYFGLDSESGITNPSTHPPNGTVGFSFFAKYLTVFFCYHGQLLPRAPVAKRQTRGSAKPVFAGSIPARRSIHTNRIFGEFTCRKQTHLLDAVIRWMLTPSLSLSAWPF